MSKNLTVCLQITSSDEWLWKSWIRNHGDMGPVIVGTDGIDPAKLAGLNIDCFVNPLNNDFAAAKNAILSRVTTPFALFLDADELCTPRTKTNLAHILHNPLNIKNGDAFGIYFLNVFNRHFCEPNLYPVRLMRKEVRLINNSPTRGASPGCHETPLPEYRVMNLPPEHFEILHLKEVWNGNFRNKGYRDANHEAAQADLFKKIKATQ